MAFSQGEIEMEDFSLDVKNEKPVEPDELSMQVSPLCDRDGEKSRHVKKDGRKCKSHKGYDEVSEQNGKEFYKHEDY